MNQIERIRSILSGIDVSHDSVVRTDELSLMCIRMLAVTYYNNTMLCGSFCPFYTKALDDIRDDLERKGDSEGTTAVDAVEKALESLANYFGDQIPYLDEELLEAQDYRFERSFTTFHNYFQRIDDMKEDFPRLFQEFRDVLRGLLPYVSEDLKVRGITPSEEVSLKSIFLDLLGMEGGRSAMVNEKLRTFPECLNTLGITVLNHYFDYAVNDKSLENLERVKQELNVLEKVINRCRPPKSQRTLLQCILRGVRESLDSLAGKIRSSKTLSSKVQILEADQTFRTAYGQAIANLKENRVSFAATFNELDKMLETLREIRDETMRKNLSEADANLDDLRQKIDELEKALPPPLRLHRRLGLVFAAILVVQCILWYLEEEDSATRRAWNTGVYSLAVAGTIVYQVWRLATRYRDDGVIGMLREEWTAVGCIVPMAAGLLHGGVVRSSVYSMTVAGIGAVMMAVQGGVLCGMSLMQVCVVVCGNLVLGALCVGGDGEWSLYLCVAAVVFASVLLLVLNVGGGGEKSVGEGIESMVFVMSMLVCVCVSYVCGRDYDMVYGGGGVPEKYLRAG
ncbi:hypothetical protein [Encephalitozoon cuniculi GB-M1]|uniref:Uncharacterized protein n=1 Tax=Encephalitozoon cuniculi (strain GB-M1) TaxID=284813 RepID=Q8STQ7_ENCCU|nr:uncharacterized protein ECU09_1120 [Encephalitozoon cuniculi GB-M1]CAD27085.2 hypothetical protein [Encephalitozoon cuniculi GB-M1]